jgi:hypothetical protein
LIGAKRRVNQPVQRGSKGEIEAVREREEIDRQTDTERERDCSHLAQSSSCCFVQDSVVHFVKPKFFISILHNVEISNGMEEKTPTYIRNRTAFNGSE